MGFDSKTGYQLDASRWSWTNTKKWTGGGDPTLIIRKDATKDWPGPQVWAVATSHLTSAGSWLHALGFQNPSRYEQRGFFSAVIATLVVPPRILAELTTVPSKLLEKRSFWPHFWKEFICSPEAGGLMQPPWYKAERGTGPGLWPQATPAGKTYLQLSVSRDGFFLQLQQKFFFFSKNFLQCWLRELSCPTLLAKTAILVKPCKVEADPGFAFWYCGRNIS